MAGLFTMDLYQVVIYALPSKSRAKGLSLSLSLSLLSGPRLRYRICMLVCLPAWMRAHGSRVLQVGR